jgi:hypothetical protein
MVSSDACWLPLRASTTKTAATTRAPRRPAAYGANGPDTVGNHTPLPIRALCLIAEERIRKAFTGQPRLPDRVAAGVGGEAEVAGKEWLLIGRDPL